MVDVQNYGYDGVLYFLTTVLDKKLYTDKNTHFKCILLLHILQPQGREGESDPTKKRYYHALRNSTHLYYKLS